MRPLLSEKIHLNGFHFSRAAKQVSASVSPTPLVRDTPVIPFERPHPFTIGCGCLPAL
jgi:hypothetical protein